ncbi:MAG: response regulator [Acidimicrobiales bacterium]
MLVVDDDEVIRGMLAFLLEGDGHTVEQATGGEAALEVLRRRSPDCMVLDLMMPDVDGLAVLHARQAEGLAPETRIVVLTARAEGDDATWCWEAGADEFLTKPFDPDRLLRLVRVLADLSPADAQHRRQQGLAHARQIAAIDTALRGRPL